MSGGDVKDIIIVLIGALVTLGVEWIRRHHQADRPPPKEQS